MMIRRRQRRNIEQCQMHAFRTYILPKFSRLQRGLSAIAELLVIFLCVSTVSAIFFQNLVAMATLF